MFAVIEVGGKQRLVKSGDSITVEKLAYDAGKNMSFDKVLLVANEDGTNVTIGAPYVSGVSVAGTIEAHGRAKKIRVAKYKRKVRYKRAHGHRQHFTKVKIGVIA